MNFQKLQQHHPKVKPSLQKLYNNNLTAIQHPAPKKLEKIQFKKIVILIPVNAWQLQKKEQDVQGRQEQTDIVGNMEDRLKFTKEFQIPLGGSEVLK